MEKVKKRQFKAITIYPKELEEAQYKNCENMIGAVQVPLGIAGPLRINGNYAKDGYFIPLATTEAALIASVNRGCKAIMEASGAVVYSEYEGITRGPVFTAKNLKESFKFKSWLAENFSILTQVAHKTSSYLQLKKIHTQIIGRQIFVRFSFDTSDAMGMNMVTFATDALKEFIEKKTGVTCLSLAGNFDADKKPAWLNFIQGRGRQVWAQASLEKQTVKEVLKTTPEKIHEVTIAKCLLGSAAAGSLGFNAHFANIIAAIFIATGQDAAHVAEGSLGITSTEVIDERLYISVYLPDLIIGTVGGGTNLPAQTEALKLLDVSGGNHGKNAAVFAEIIGAAILAGEISLLASLSEGSLASTHKRLARK